MRNELPRQQRPNRVVFIRHALPAFVFEASEFSVAARKAGLAELEITRTLNSARRTAHTQPSTPSHQAEGETK